MAHVQIKKAEKGFSKVEVLVNGVDISHDIFHEGFCLRWVGSGEHSELGLQMIVAVDTLDADVADGVIVGPEVGDTNLLAAALDRLHDRIDVLSHTIKNCGPRRPRSAV